MPPRKTAPARPIAMQIDFLLGFMIRYFLSVLDIHLESAGMGVGFQRQCPGGAGLETFSEPVAEIFSDQTGFSADQGENVFATGADTVPAAIAEVAINVNS